MTRLVLVTTIWIAAAACGGSRAATTTTTPAAPPSNTGGTTTETTDTTPAPAADDRAVCANHPDEMGPYLLTDAQAAQRTGQGVRSIGALPATTKAHPVEVCGVAAENAWLAGLTCADGSHPYRGPQDVEASRAGNVGAGGRCGGIIDLYKVPCPDHTYDVYMDMYLCGPGESFM
jgi:hypothetical protein